MDSHVWKPEETREINVCIPVNLFNQIESAGYENPTQAITKALKILFQYPQEDTEGYKKDIKECRQEIDSLKDERDKWIGDINRYIQKIQKSEKEIEDYKYRLRSLQNSIQEQDKDIKAMDDEIEKLKRDLAKAPDLVTFTEMKVKYEESEKRIKTLERDKEDLKAMNNIFIQTLINQKAIGSPKESSHAPKEEAFDAGSNIGSCTRVIDIF